MPPFSRALPSDVYDALRRGERWAQDLVAGSLFPYLLESFTNAGWAAKLGGKDDLIVDAVTDGLLKAVVGRIDTYKPTEAFYPWVYQVVKHMLIDEARKPEHAVFSARDPTIMDDSYPDGGEGPEEALIAQERRQAIDAAIACLPETQRRAVILKYFEGRTHVEIATELGITVGTSRNYLHKAKTILRAQLPDRSASSA